MSGKKAGKVDHPVPRTEFHRCVRRHAGDAGGLDHDAHSGPRRSVAGHEMRDAEDQLLGVRL